ncbi:phosphomannomutase/phosphoglucomutase [Propioniciclava coleopterorum]|uniref:Phosphomannomutase/phosphoglucomutase n=1 Tax=Propioniciclava coleopterorum TaxID=2714937 RepID=A0A6G7Y3C2_9ACTN|nr:phosphomannomutase/phosphoglucomutase [Propioniciclava coleopterorum]QIK71330.1 phosphomannomutase/phosphoglucomutase [Propioniciclava coleopterorum]
MITAAVFKANDIRGLIGGPDAEWDLDGARAVGAAYVRVFDLAGREFVMGRDMRLTGPAVAAAFAEGAREQGASVVDVGLASTDGLWYASGTLGLHGVQFTASHNPAGYNGVKFCLPGAAPVTPEDLVALREVALGPDLPPAPRRGGLRTLDVLDGYAAHLRSLVDLDGMRRLRVVVDAGNGMAGLTTDAVLGPLNLDVVGLYLDLDGTFPHHMPNPLIPENLVDAQRAVRETGADVGLVFDGDADRCFIIDERGEVVTPSVVTALIAGQELAREPGGTIVINTITSRAVGEVVARLGGRLVVSKVGHTSVKAAMAEHDAIFGGEHSAHYYFRDFWGADTGMLAGLNVLAMLGHGDATMSELAARVDGYVPSGELNATVPDAGVVLADVRAAFAGRGVVDDTDGVTVSTDDWWVNVRPSNTEPLVRLNAEARDRATMAALRDEALAIINRRNR